jgi:hypothetical protein
MAGMVGQHGSEYAFYCEIVAYWYIVHPNKVVFYALKFYGMNKTLYGLAFLTYNWDHYKKDIIDSYVHLVCQIIVERNFQWISKDQIRESLTESYGITIPGEPSELILRRMINAKLIEKDGTECRVQFYPVCDYIKGSEKNKAQLISGYTVLVADLQAYAQNQFQLEFTKIEIDDGIISFLKEYDVDIQFASHSESVLPKVKESKKLKYIIARFIVDVQKSDPAKFLTILKIAQGHAIASLITYENIQVFTGGLSDVEVYLDAPIIFSLIGLNGESNLTHTKELITVLKKHGAKIKVFDLNYEEVVTTINDAIGRLKSGNYNLQMSSRVLRTAIRDIISAQQLQIKLNQIDAIIVREDIKRAPLVAIPESEFEFQIDLKNLIRSIKAVYEKQGARIMEYSTMQNQVERDAEVIAYASDQVHIDKLSHNAYRLWGTKFCTDAVGGLVFC